VKMICAALQAPQPPARTSTRTPTRTSTRTSFSQGRPLHRKWRAHDFASCAHHFAWSRTPFLPAAQAILLGGAHHFACCPSPGPKKGVWNSPASINAGVLSASKFQTPFFGPGKGDWQPEGGWCEPGRHGGLSPWSHDALADSRRCTGTGPRGGETNGTTNWLPNIVPRGQAPRRRSQLPKRARPVAVWS